MTRDAVFAFQSIFGLQITGIVGQVTWNRLMTEAANVGRSVEHEYPMEHPYQGVQTVGKPNLGVQTRFSPLMFYLLSNKRMR
jgi:hypothetical protein